MGLRYHNPEGEEAAGGKVSWILETKTFAVLQRVKLGRSEPMTTMVPWLLILQGGGACLLTSCPIVLHPDSELPYHKRGLALGTAGFGESRTSGLFNAI